MEPKLVVTDCRPLQGLQLVGKILSHLRQVRPPIFIFILLVAVSIACNSISRILPTPTTTSTAIPTIAPTQTPTSIPAPTHTPDSKAIRVVADGSGDYPDLKAAVAAVPEGGTIILEAGTYHLEESLDINKSFSLLGVGPDQTEIVSEAQGYVVRFNGDGRFAVEDLTIRHEGKAVADVVVVRGGEVAFAHCGFSGAVGSSETNELRAGLRLEGNTTGLVQACSASKNFIGILVTDEASPTLERNICEANESDGIVYYGEASGAARENECTSNRFGIAVDDQASPILERNICTNNTVGIGVDSQAQPTLEGNKCNDNQDTGIGYYGNSSGVAHQNECSGNHEGIAV